MINCEVEPNTSEAPAPESVKFWATVMLPLPSTANAFVVTSAVPDALTATRALATPAPSAGSSANPAWIATYSLRIGELAPGVPVPGVPVAL